MSLTDREKSILELERQWFRYPGAKEQRVRDMLGLRIARYYQALNALIDREDAMAFDPLTVKRLRRIRDSKLRPRGSLA